MVEVIRWYQIWLIEFVLDVSWVMLTKLLGVYCVGVYYWNIGVYVLDWPPESPDSWNHLS